MKLFVLFLLITWDFVAPSNINSHYSMKIPSRRRICQVLRGGRSISAATADSAAGSAPSKISQLGTDHDDEDIDDNTIDTDTATIDDMDISSSDTYEDDVSTFDANSSSSPSSFAFPLSLSSTLSPLTSLVSSPISYITKSSKKVIHNTLPLRHNIKHKHIWGDWDLDITLFDDEEKEKDNLKDAKSSSIISGDNRKTSTPRRKADQSCSDLPLNTKAKATVHLSSANILTSTVFIRESQKKSDEATKKMQFKTSYVFIPSRCYPFPSKLLHNYAIPVLAFKPEAISPSSSLSKPTLAKKSQSNTTLESSISNEPLLIPLLLSGNFERKLMSYSTIKWRGILRSPERFLGRGIFRRKVGGGEIVGTFWGRRRRERNEEKRNLCIPNEVLNLSTKKKKKLNSNSSGSSSTVAFKNRKR